MTSGIASWKDFLEFGSYLAVVLGVPAALVQYVRATLKEQKDREYGTYDELDDKYLDYQRLCLENPELDIWDIPDDLPKVLSQVERKRELQVFTVLFSIFERAYLMYSDMSSEVKRTQWHGWEEYIRSYSKRENFSRAWKQGGSTFATDFTRYMDALIADR
jgi:hypothetical protein